ncbi:glycosyltransferase [Deltaproteobacteria bacterium TL4]
MKIGFYIKWNKFSINSQGNVIGDELLGESLCNVINKIFPDCHAELYAPNYLPKDKLEVMVYLNDIPPQESLAKRHILYLQNGGYGEQAADLLERLAHFGYDHYIFFSKQLLELHQHAGGEGLFLPFGVDTDFFQPRCLEQVYRHDVAYVGNDIKGEERTMQYLYPAIEFNFGLYGNWRLPRSRLKFWKNWKRVAPYKIEFEKLSKGKIPQEKVPVLYSSAKINLNCTLQDCVDWEVITLRTYEVLACKGFLISDIVPVAKETMQGCLVFTEGHEMLREQIRYYLAHEKERDDIAQNGYEYVTQHASISVRARELVNYIQ